MTRRVPEMSRAFAQRHERLMPADDEHIGRWTVSDDAANISAMRAQFRAGLLASGEALSDTRLRQQSR